MVRYEKNITFALKNETLLVKIRTRYENRIQ